MHKWPQIIVARFNIYIIHYHSKLRKDFSFSGTIDWQQPSKLSSCDNYYENTPAITQYFQIFSYTPTALFYALEMWLKCQSDLGVSIYSNGSNSIFFATIIFTFFVSTGDTLAKTLTVSTQNYRWCNVNKFPQSRYFFRIKQVGSKNCHRIWFNLFSCHQTELWHPFISTFLLLFIIHREKF